MATTNELNELKINVLSKAQFENATREMDALYLINDDFPTPEEIGAASLAPPAAAGNIAALTADGNLQDSGKKPGDFLSAMPSKYSVATMAAYESAISSELSSMKDGEARFFDIDITVSTLPIIGGIWNVRLHKTSADFAVYEAISFAYPSYGKIVNSLYLGSWVGIEYENPPMTVGVEYRTTERYNGKPVYCKAVDFGALPNATTKNVAYSPTATTAVLGLTIVLSDGTSLALGVNYDFQFSNVYTIKVSNTKQNICIITEANFSSLTATAFIKYTKD